MNKDKELEELFLSQKPHFDDNEAFMASLNERMDAVEYIKQYQEAELRRYKTMMLAAFIVGVISGGVALAFILVMPAGTTLFTFHVQNGVLSWLAKNSRPIVVTVLTLLMSFGLVSIVHNILDIIGMRKHTI